MWTEIQMLAKFPPHPISCFSICLSSTSNTPQSSRPRFKLKWLKQLMRTVDDLNLKHGIIHQDIADRNLIVDPDTGSIALIDFNLAYQARLTKQGPRDREGKWAERDDVKGVLVFLYEYITQDPTLAGGLYTLNEVNETKSMDPAKWAKHPSVELDKKVADFYSELMAWVRHRAGKQLTRYTEAPDHFEWPSAQEVEKKQGRCILYSVAERRRAGLPHLSWRRPPSSMLDPTRRLLATGRYADEEEAAQNAIAKPVAAASKNFVQQPPFGRLSPDTAPIIPPATDMELRMPSLKRPLPRLEPVPGSKPVPRLKLKPAPRMGLVLGLRQKRKREGDDDAGMVVAPDKAVKNKKRLGRSAKARSRGVMESSCGLLNSLLTDSF
ncbi:hypothetical protein N657DRAFT_673734 [Parathielavia appendiculata]|uniref:Aminoglycoside phosphotransferase domain-containing protein n=1 Tax=Parathielavia appendiculata TaxID=2587402 RepID=A0AAN6Z2C1_9PEZI|nr:hypothetical protein N657DRAFT_673734 [Parathielavia appendiculata]